MDLICLMENGWASAKGWFIPVFIDVHSEENNETINMRLKNYFYLMHLFNPFFRKEYSKSVLSLAKDETSSQK